MTPLPFLDPAPLLNALVRNEEASSCSDGCLTRWKVAFAALLLLEGLFFGHAVILLKRFTARDAFHAVVHFGHALSAGVFFATGMLHVLPEAIELVSGDGDVHVERQEEDHGDDDHEEHEEHGAEFPWAFLAIMLSFYLLFFVEKILIPKFAQRYSAREEGIDTISKSNAEESNAESKDESKFMTSQARSHTVTSNDDLDFAGFRSKEFVNGLIEILGLSAHSLFESMALGLSGEFGTVLNIFIATASHRWATSLAIAFELARRLAYKPFLVLLVLFSTMVPLGVGIGAALTDLPNKAQGVLFSISGGTFIYIGVFESMAEEFVEHRKWPMRKFAATMAGACIIIVTTVLLIRFDVHG